LSLLFLLSTALLLSSPVVSLTCTFGNTTQHGAGLLIKSKLVFMTVQSELIILRERKSVIENRQLNLRLTIYEYWRCSIKNRTYKWAICVSKQQIGNNDAKLKYES